MPEIDDDIYEGGKKPLSLMSESEKEKVVLYNDEGKPLYYSGNNHWIPVVAFVSKEEILAVKSHYPKPRLYPFRIILQFLIPFILVAFLNLSLYIVSTNIRVEFDLNVYVIASISFLALYLLLNLGSIVIFAIRLYQKFAKDETRERCHLHPTCSFYAIYAIEKYGLIIGVIKAIRRLKRCSGQEGEDWP